MPLHPPPPPPRGDGGLVQALGGIFDVLVDSMGVPAERRAQLPFARGLHFNSGGGVGADGAAAAASEEEEEARADALGADLRRLATGLPAAFTVDDLARLVAAVDAHAAAAALGPQEQGRVLDASACWAAGAQRPLSVDLRGPQRAGANAPTHPSPLPLQASSTPFSPPSSIARSRARGPTRRLRRRPLTRLPTRPASRAASPSAPS